MTCLRIKSVGKLAWCCSQSLPDFGTHNEMVWDISQPCIRGLLPLNLFKQRYFGAYFAGPSIIAVSFFSSFPVFAISSRSWFAASCTSCHPEMQCTSINHPPIHPCWPCLPGHLATTTSKQTHPKYSKISVYACGLQTKNIFYRRQVSLAWE